MLPTSPLSFARLLLIGLLNCVFLPGVYAAPPTPAPANSRTTSPTPTAPNPHDAPDKFVQQIVDQTLDALRNDRSLKTHTMHRVHQVVGRYVLPYADFEKTTRLAAGTIWRDATPTQRKQLTAAFRQTLVRTYSGALGEVDQNTQVKIVPQTSAETRQQNLNKKDVIIYSVLNQPNRDPVQINYRMENTPDGWKVYDLIIENLSLIISYRAQFQQQMSRNKAMKAQNGKNAIDGLIDALNKKNAQLEE